MARLKITLKMRPKNPGRKFKKVPKDLQREFIKQIRKLERDALTIVRRNTPVRTGRLRDSFKSKRTIRKKALFGKIEVFSPLPYARFIDEGTRRSPGRYVPAIDRRLTTDRPGFGFHPGIRATNFLKKSEATVVIAADRISLKLQKSIDRSVTRHFKGR